MIRHISQMLASKQISCVELTQLYLDAINKENDDMRVYITVTADEALQAARAVDAKIAAGEQLSPLAGIPMTLKDNISTTGIETTCASKMLQGYRPIYDATSWQILKDQGAVLLGKTNMDEFAMGSTCETSIMGGARNPHNRDYVSGGSSGGGAAAVGGNLAVYALGSDTGGSIRQPASFCGIVGFKPTYGTVSRYGLLSYASSFDQIGPLTASVEDAAIVFDAIAQYDTMDSTSQGKREPVTPTLDQPIKGLRIGIPHEYYADIADDVRAAMEQSIRVFEDMGAEIVRFSFEAVKYSLPVYYILACAEAASNLGRFDGIRYGYQASGYNGVNEMISKTRSEGFGAEVKRRIMLGNYVLSAGYYDAYYKKAQNLRGKIVRAFDEAFGLCDLLLVPTTPTRVFASERVHGASTEEYNTDLFTVPVNIAGLPGISVPCGVDSNGMPVGMQLIGQRFDEARLLRAANAFEKAGQWVKPVEMGVRL